MINNEAKIRKPIGANISVKLSKTSLLLLSGGIIVVAIFSLFVIHKQQIVQQQTLNRELSAANKRLVTLQLGQLSAQQSQLGQQNDQAVAELALIKQQVAVNIDSIAGSESLYAIAKESGVKITGLGALASSKDKLGGVAATVLPMTVTINGDWLKLVDFITRLKTEFPTCLLQNANIVIPADPTQTPSADLEISIYTYKGN